MNAYEAVGPFMDLFKGLDEAYGTGKGQWIKRPPTRMDYLNHLQGRGPGLGIAPLMRDGRVWFASIDLDEPDFDAAQEMQEHLPGVSWLERSRSGNAHVHVFFQEPIEAWVPRGILKKATISAGKDHVEVFPKQDQLRNGSLGNYINLPFHGDSRPIFSDNGPGELPLEDFLLSAESKRNDPAAWRKRATWLGIKPPEKRDATSEFGTQRQLHMCAEYIVENRDVHPLREGHRANVFFALAKQFSNCALFSHDEALEHMLLVNEAAVDKTPVAEIERILSNAEEGEFTSTGCDDPVVAPYCHPDCPIAHPN